VNKRNKHKLLVHNFVDNSVKWDNQPWGNRPQIGNARWMNNIFIGGGLDPEIVEDQTIYDRNVYYDSATYHPNDIHKLILNQPSNFNLEENIEGIRITLSIGSTVFGNSFSLIDSDYLNLPFKFPIETDVDFDGLRRKGKNMAGPFMDIKPGINSFVVYKYPKLYDRALEIIGGID
jgi:hypothetical protein